MADNVTFQTSVTATPPNATTVATDDVGGAQYQRIKLDIGGDGVSSPVTILNPIPIGTLAGGTVVVSGTVQVLGSVQGVGTFQMLGTLQALAGSVHVANVVFGTFQAHGTAQIIGTVQPLAGSVHIASTGTLPLGTVQALGTFQPLAGSVHIANTISGTVQAHGTSQVIGTFQAHGTAQALGTFQPLAGSVNAQGVIAHGAVTTGNPMLSGAFGSSGTQAAVADGQLTRLWADLNGRLQIRGTIDSMPAINVASGTIPGGTVQAFGTTEILGTVRALTTVNVTVGTINEGTINSFTGTAQVLGTVQAHGSIQVLGSVQIHGTAQVLGSVQTHGTSQIIGTVRFLDGSVHLAAGSVYAQGVAAHGAAVAGNPVLWGGFGSSGTQVAVDDGDLVRPWFDLNGRMQMRGTIDSMPSITIGAALPAGDNNIGNVDVVTMPTVTVTATNLDIRDLTSASDSVAVVGTVQAHGTTQALGTFQAHGSIQALGTMQPLAGSVHIASALAGGSLSMQGYLAHDAAGASNPLVMGGIATRARPGTVAVDDTVRGWFDQQGRMVVQIGAGTAEPFGTMFGGAGANGTIRAGLAGSFMRIHDIVVSGSAAGTFRLLQDTATIVGPLFLAANGGWNSNSAPGMKLTAAGASLVAAFSAGSWSVAINYSFEGF